MFYFWHINSNVFYNPTAGMLRLTVLSIPFLSSFFFTIIYIYINLDYLDAQSVPLSWLPPPISVLMPRIGLVSQRVSKVLVGEEGPSHLVDLVVGADGPEVLDVVPEVRGGVGPVGDCRQFVIRH